MDPRSDQSDRAGGAGSLARQAGEWLAWIGPARLASTVIALAVVALGAVWLFRSPPPDLASGLAVATTTTTTTTTEVAPAGTDPPPSTAPVVVHVTGAVREPGVFELPAGARIRDAVAAAGGPTPRADESLLNLAAPLVDGSRIEVPRSGDTVALVEIPSAGDSAQPPGPVDVNRATASELEVLPGVGPATAAAIVTERETNGPFLSVDDVERVPGIGPARLAALRDLIVT